jgi:trans-aconitate 2-methyltransferase
MTEWDAGGYSKQSSLQQWVAGECLAGLTFIGTERVLDIGCGDGKMTAAIAQRLDDGSIIGIDPSSHMIEFADRHFGAPAHPNLRFAVADVRQLPYRDAFDLIVSFNALHWVPEQAVVLACIREALSSTGRAVLQFVSRGPRKSLEAVIEDTRGLPRWSRYFPGYRAPFVHFTPDEYRGLATAQRLRVDNIEAQLKAWDFKTREAFAEFATVTFVEWTRLLPSASRSEFIGEVLDGYRRVGDGSAADANVFHFYQMRVELRRD